ncbi:hypothetical protein ACLKMH_13310 [Psychromonas sp. KJ10-10]|uniref:hypothetical protein n=1 Tax=Psychromonas sp. KJ10-10 TaxID=3391823 RepID=UPI0039B3C988
MLGGRIGDDVLIESGLEVGDRIVVQGLVNMSDGLSIKDLSAENNVASNKNKKGANKEEAQ